MFPEIREYEHTKPPRVCFISSLSGDGATLGAFCYRFGFLFMSKTYSFLISNYFFISCITS